MLAMYLLGIETMPNPAEQHTPTNQRFNGHSVNARLCSVSRCTFSVTVKQLEVNHGAMNFAGDWNPELDREILDRCGEQYCFCGEGQ